MLHLTMSRFPLFWSVFSIVLGSVLGTEAQL